MQTLRRRRVVKNSKLHSVGFVSFKTSEFDYARQSSKEAVSAYGIELVSLR